jgi:hypothetical protein
MHEKNYPLPSPGDAYRQVPLAFPAGKGPGYTSALNLIHYSLLLQ